MGADNKSPLKAGRRGAESPPRRRRETRGFALLITIVLLAFLVLLLVSLATLTRVETQVASNNQQLGQARQNALLALNVALGQLQSHTGPDQRVTARAEILDTDPLNRDGDGNPVVDGVPNPYWTGVWDSSGWDPLTGRYSGAPVNNAIRGRTRPDPIAWLVSGNESDPVDRRPTTALTGDTQALAYAVAADGSADLSTPLVEVPLMEIQSDAVPGLAGPQAVGRYAWWVGDEGVKAKVSATPPEVVAGATSGAPFYWKAMAPHRAGGELISTGGTRTFPEFSHTGALSVSGETLRDQLQRVFSPEQLPFLRPSAAATEIMPQAGVRRHAFDLTTVSGGVLADTVRGGLRLDLTRYLQTGNTDGAFNANAAIYQDAVDAGLVSGDRLPAFSLIKSWYDIGRGLSGGGFSAAAPWQKEETSGSVITRMGVTPVVLRATLHYAVAADPAPGGQVTLLVKPHFMLWNPHNVAISATDLIAEIEEDAIIQIAAEARRTATPTQQLATPKRYLTDSTVNYRQVRLKDLPGWGARFRLQGVDLEPGQTITYEPASNDPINPASPPLLLPRGSNLYAFRFDLPGMQLDSSVAAPAADESVFFFWNHTLNVSYPATATGKSRSTQSTDPTDNRFLIRLYLASDTSSPLLDLRTPLAIVTTVNRIGTVEPLAQSSTDLTRSRFWTGEFPALLKTVAETRLLLGTRPYSLGNVARLRLPFDGASLSTGRSQSAAALPYAQFNLRAAFGALTSFEMIIPSDYPTGTTGTPWESCPLYTWGIGPLTTGTHPDHPWAGPYNTNQGQGLNYILFDYPRRETAPSGSTLPAVVSLGELQHVDFTSMSTQPGYAFGSGWPDPRISRDKVAGLTTEFNFSGGIETSNSPVNAPNNVYLRDVPYLVNHALWDRFFLSTLPQSGAVPRTDGTSTATFDARTLLPNTALTPMPASSGAFATLDDVRDVRQAAGNFLLSGAFNINSTSVNAWRAFLGGLADIELPSGTGSVGGSVASHATLRHNYSRFLLPRANAFDAAAHGPGTINGPQRPAAWQGSRYLSDAEIDVLARNLVEEVKVRGPFLSIADFVNRRLVPSTADGPMGGSNLDEYRRKVGVSGALHKAILNLSDLSQGLNASLSQPAMAVVDGVNYGGPATAQRTFSVGGGASYSGWRAITNPDRLETLNGGLLGQLNHGAPGFLTPGDILQKIGARIAARSDTFVIRAYGETLNPATGDREGQAWLEAVVQRMPYYVDSSQAASTGSSASSSGSLNPTNQQFGRRYEIVSFRWLTPSDL